ncbi:MAG: corrinoid protein [Candidatus Marinimicrobia bacterium]|jgi:5-methyltetrahydrofolate--homocysteine methyltransferase|nr:corrinoid protein [Candidatus Neomarinimicrobiota bacterium]MBT3631666.1 corrinoid protein [Candidatus Neomarinimicrobiota bacterium]MBT3825867.1 corrinoid protein [Candidatus Neomarinimicrobiota bacterium]MBT4129964.1 corrinoid protein [Candidatus Neomarinimicrobiota bacterium]MBT4296050.1 corrinoid protein [Candidatus Neomarinimicrobiota bacterium]
MSSDSIQQAIIMGNVASISTDVNQLLNEGVNSQNILDEQLLPGMAIVGDRFKRNEMFLPQVLMSAQAMQTAIDILKPHLAGNSEARQRQTVIIGTVKGDMHDIGKNLVRIMLIGAGFEVIDLGVNVPTQRFLEATTQHQAAVVCLSALLSSTMNNMKDVVATFRNHSDLKDTKILIGGAPVSHEFSQNIGADGYAPTAPAAVERVQQLCGQ